MTRMILAIPTGDPVGVGPEVFVKALAHPEAMGDARLIVMGSVPILERAAKVCGVKAAFRAVEDIGGAAFEPGVLDVLELGCKGLEQLEPGQVHAETGKASVEYVIRAAEMALAGEVDAVVTGPIHKEAVRAGGYHQYIGNTEIFEDVCSRHTGRDFMGKCMTMLITKNLRVAHATRHVPFREIVDRLTPEKLADSIRLTARGMASLGFPAARVAVAGLNPHNGDGGLMGREEIELIAPVVERVRSEGVNVVGPVPADSIFFQAIGGAYDAVVALYHDQGHIAIKVHGFEESITISLGIPVIRTSVDHGTAFDIVGQGSASEKGMVAAIQLAKEIVTAGKWSEGVAETEAASHPAGAAG